MPVKEITIHSDFEADDEYTVSGEDLSAMATDIAQAVARIGIIGTVNSNLETETILIGETLMKTLGRIDRRIVRQIFDNSKAISRQILEMALEERSGSVVN